VFQTSKKNITKI